MPWGVAAAAVGAVGSLAASSMNKPGATSGTTTNAPWGPQGTELQKGYNQADTNMASQLASGPYGGEYTAGPNAAQGAAQNQAETYGLGTGANMASGAAGVANTLEGNAGLYGSNAANMASGTATNVNAGTMNNLNSYASGNGMAGVQGMNQGLSSALNNAATQGANAIGGYNSGLTSVANQGTSNPTSQIAANAQQYMNGAPTQAALNNVNNQISQTLNEQTNPGMNRAAAAGGNLNSSRAGMAEAMNNENASISMGNADSSILNNAYNTGMNTASSQYTSGLNTSLAANEAGLAGNTALAQGTSNTQLNTQLGEANSQINAGNSALGQQTSSDALNANTQLAGNAQLGAGVNTGLNAGLDSEAAANSNYGLGATAGAAQQAGQQATDTNAYNQWQGNTNYDSQVLNNYMGVVGGGSYGSTGTSNGTNTAPSNAAANVVGGASAGAGLYNLYQNSGNNNPAVNTNSNQAALNNAMTYSPGEADAGYGYNP